MADMSTTERLVGIGLLALGVAGAAYSVNIGLEAYEATNNVFVAMAAAKMGGSVAGLGVGVGLCSAAFFAAGVYSFAQGVAESKDEIVREAKDMKKMKDINRGYDVKEYQQKLTNAKTVVKEFIQTFPQFKNEEKDLIRYHKILLDDFKKQDGLKTYMEEMKSKSEWEQKKAFGGKTALHAFSAAKLFLKDLEYKRFDKEQADLAEKAKQEQLAKDKATKLDGLTQEFEKTASVMLSNLDIEHTENGGTQFVSYIPNEKNKNEWQKINLGSSVSLQENLVETAKDITFGNENKNISVINLEKMANDKRKVFLERRAEANDYMKTTISNFCRESNDGVEISKGLLNNLSDNLRSKATYKPLSDAQIKILGEIGQICQDKIDEISEQYKGFSERVSNETRVFRLIKRDIDRVNEVNEYWGKRPQTNFKGILRDAKKYEVLPSRMMKDEVNLGKVVFNEQGLGGRA